MSNRFLENVVLGEDESLMSWLIRGLLWLPATLYEIGLAIYLWLYNIGLRKRRRLPVPVISVGNLTFGGTGKTPAVQTISRMLTERGVRVTILSRGHGGSARGVVIASDGQQILSTAAEVGDEPMLLARSLPEAPIVVGRDRRKSGALACERFSPDAILLDDGMQYWQLHRDIDIVVLDANKPFGSGFLMPMGDLREPPSGLRRGGIILLVNAAALPEAEHGVLVRRLSRLAPDALIFACAREPVCLRNVETGQEHDLKWIAGRKVYAFCGIGRPRSFFDVLGGLGASIVGNKVFPDHYRLSKADIVGIIDEARGAEAIVTTEKDVARLDGTPIPGLYALAIKLGIEDNSRFAEYITDRINCKNTPAVN